MGDIFKQYPNIEVYYQTSDGTKFYKEETAKTHARTLADKSVKTVTRTMKSEDVSLLSKAADIIALVPQMPLETAQTYLGAENKKDSPRVSVLDALNARIKSFDIENIDPKALLQSEAEIMALVPNMDAETAKEYLNAEFLNDPQRTGVVDALNARITELEVPQS